MKGNFLQLITVFIAILLLGISSCNKDDDLDINTIEDFDLYLQEEMDYDKIPALSVLIFRENQVLYEKNYGKSHIEKSVELKSDHLFLLASVSKVITATALLQLYEQNLFTLDDEINDYLPFKVVVPNYSTPITFRMLLTHTSAIEDGSALDNQYYYGKDSPTELRYFIENYLVAGGVYYNSKENFYNFKPGSKYEYSNEGNALIAVLVEQISNMNFNSYCKQNIFTPLGMNHTFWRLDEIAQANLTIVQPYEYNKRKYEAIEHYTFTDYPNGGLRSTATDLFTFLQAFVLDGKSNNYQLLQPQTIEEMTTLQIPSLSSEMGLHLFKLSNEHNIWGHDGGEQGVATIMGFNPITKTGAIILTNQGDAYLDEILVEAYKIGTKL